MPLQNSKNLFDCFLSVLESGIDIGEVKGKGENDEEEGYFKEKTR
jgi:hypothetical protein